MSRYHRKILNKVVLGSVAVLLALVISYCIDTHYENVMYRNQILEKYVQALGGRTALERLTTRVCTGNLIHDIHWRQPPYENVRFQAYAKVPWQRLVVHNTSQGVTREGQQGSVHWKHDENGLTQLDLTEKSKFAWLLDPQGPLNIQDYFPDLLFQSIELIDDRTVSVLVPAAMDKAHWSLAFDLETGLLIRIGYYWELQDYREVDGIKFPFRIATSRKGGSSTYVFSDVQHNVPLSDSRFEPPFPND